MNAKPCPFCGKQVSVRYEPRLPGRRMWALRHNCAYAGFIIVEGESSRNQTMERWNTRRPEVPTFYICLKCDDGSQICYQSSDNSCGSCGEDLSGPFTEKEMVERIEQLNERKG